MELCLSTGFRMAGLRDLVSYNGIMAKFTLKDFLHGRVEYLFQAHRSPKILLLWQHPDEVLGPHLAYYLYAHRPDLLDYVDYLCGNPKAAAQDPPLHWTEADLNRSYRPTPGQPVTYEQQRARYILEIIKKGQYACVLDVHTSVADVDRFILIQTDTPHIRVMIAASTITRVIVMPPGEASLAGAVPESLTIEYSQRIPIEQAIQEYIALLENLVDLRTAPKPKQREFFLVDRHILKNEDPGLDAENFKLCKDGYYPVLLGSGPRSYREDPTKTYLCFGASRKEEVLL